MPFEFRKSVYWFSRYEQKAFSRLNRKQIFNDNNFLSSLLSNLKISRLNFENPSIKTQGMSQKPVFEGHFQLSQRNRKQIQKTKARGPYSALNSNYWRLNFEKPSINSQVKDQKLFSKVIFNFPGQSGSRFRKRKVVYPILL